MAGFDALYTFVQSLSASLRRKEYGDFKGHDSIHTMKETKLQDQATAFTPT